jgi:predicted AlkP superfamily pyrophosphatase or phosphodiesterase
LDKERLGQGKATDVLAISFSATDYLGHAFGPNSLEMEDNVLRVDRLLAKLFDLIEKTLGLEDTLIVVTADHGVDASPEYMQGLGIAAGRHYPDKFMDTANAGLQKRFKTDQKLVIAFWNPSLYLDTKVIAGLGLDVATVEQALAEEILRIPGFAYAVTRTDLLAGDVGSDPILAKVQRAFHSRRSGNVLVVQSPSWYLYPKAEEYSAMHGSPYPYDTFVPIMFGGSGIRHRVVHRPVAPEDVACTITSYLNINPPTGSTGTPFIEVLDRQ